MGDVSVGPVKIMPPACGLDAVTGQVRAARTAGRHVAVHAVDIDEVQAALDAGIGAGDRIEHLGLCLPEQLDELATRRVIVVTQPAFVTHRAGKYRSELSEPEQRWLYRLRSALDAGLAVRGSSDAPVVPARPLELVAAAVGRTLGPAERIGLTEAFGLISEPLAVGGRADLVVLGADPRTVPIDRLGEIDVLATWRDGRLLHGEPSRWATAGDGPAST